MSARCPTCRAALETAQVDTIPVRLCRDCHGALLLHADLIRILEASWRMIDEKEAEAATFHAPEGWRAEVGRACPDCARAMEKYGYMGLGAIQIDRCDACALVWLDADELQNMVLALARTNYRTARSMQESGADRLDLGGVGMRYAAGPTLARQEEAATRIGEGINLALILLRLLAR